MTGVGGSAGARTCGNEDDDDDSGAAAKPSKNMAFMRCSIGMVS